MKTDVQFEKALLARTITIVTTCLLAALTLIGASGCSSQEQNPIVGKWGAVISTPTIGDYTNFSTFEPSEFMLLEIKSDLSFSLGSSKADDISRTGTLEADNESTEKYNAPIYDGTFDGESAPFLILAYWEDGANTPPGRASGAINEPILVLRSASGVEITFVKTK